MGTNFYLLEGDGCPNCGRGGTRLHIGKSSAGWCFSLHVIPEEGLNTLSDWIARMGAAGARVVDEYGEELMLGALVQQIAGRGPGKPWDQRRYGAGGYCGYSSEADFHAQNGSQRGPRNLLRHQIDGKRCVGHGEGTWDYVAGDFS